MLEDVEQRMAELEADDRREGGPGGGDDGVRVRAARPGRPAREAIEQVNSGQPSREEALADPRIAGNPLLLAALEATTRGGEPDEPDVADPPPRRRGVSSSDYDEEDFSTHTIMR